MDSCERGWGPSQSEQEEADRPRRGVSPRQGVPCSAAVTAVGEQRHRILSRDGESLKADSNTPLTLYTTFSVWVEYDTNLFHTTLHSHPTTHSIRVRMGGRSASPWQEKMPRTLEIPKSRLPDQNQPSNLRNGHETTSFRDPWNSHFLG